MRRLRAWAGSETTPPAAASEAPVQELRSRVDRAVQVLADPALKGPSKMAERRTRVAALSALVALLAASMLVDTRVGRV